MRIFFLCVFFFLTPAVHGQEQLKPYWAAMTRGDYKAAVAAYEHGFVVADEQ